MLFLRLAAGVAIFAVGSLASGEEPRPVVLAVATKATARSTIELPGTVTPRRESSLSTRTAGLVRHLRVDAGHRVKQGEVLMELDDALAEIVLVRIAAELAQAEWRLADAQRLEEEARRLASTGAFAKSEAQSRKTALCVADAELHRVTALEKEQRELLDRHRLIAPFDGVIRAKHAEEGEWVETGDPVLELVETTGLRMDVQVPQELYPVMARKPSARVILDVYPDRSLDVKSATVVPLKDAVTRTFLVRMEMEDPESLAAPGMSARARFEWLDEDALQIPRDALIREPGGDIRVWIVTERDGESVAQSREVTIGRRLGEVLEITAGIQEGDRVVVRGNENLTEGRRVAIVSE